MKIRRCWQLLIALSGVLLAAASLFAQFDNPFDPPPASAPTRPPPAAPAPITTATLTDEQVVASMKHAIDFLLSAKRGNNWEIGPGDGGWSGPAPDQRGGETSLVLYALLHAGQSLQDDPDYGPKLNPHGKELAPVIDALCQLNPDQTYSAALMANALAMLPIKPGEKEGKPLQDALRRASNYLITAIGPRGGYTYAKAPQRSTEGDFRGDLSNSQYAALGMWALEEVGLAAPPGYWQVTDRLWRTTQLPSGSWPYSANAGPAALQRDTMGVAGIASLILAQEYLDKQLRSTPLVDRNIELATAWLNVNFKPDSGDLYYMYGIERVGMANGLKFIGATDWYRACAAEIISHQQPDGAWDTRSWTPGFQGTTPTTATSFALLFLARGRNPVLFNKLQYEGGGGWNARPRDDAFLTRWLSKRLERPLNWQVVNLQVAPEQWLDAPILLITGSKDPQFTPADIEKIRAFIDAGGMVFSTADDGSTPFTAAMRKVAGEVAKGRYEMRTLQKTHILFNSDLNAELATAPQLMGMSNGIREIWIHSPVDLGASWQLQKFSTKAHFEIPTALYFYATGKIPLRAKLKQLEIPLPETPPTRKIALARVNFTGNWNPEPGAWPRLSKLLLAQGTAGIDLDVTDVSIAALNPKKYPVAHMIGTARFLIKDEDCQSLQNYLDGGGTLLAEAGGGNEAFTESFTDMMKKVYPDAQFEPLPDDHPIYTGTFATAPGQKAAEIDFRKYGILTLGKRITAPAIDGLTLNGRTRVLFSRYDLSSGLVGVNTWGIMGYTPESAVKLAENMVRFTMEPAARAASQPQ